jgi:hypothetical protein
MTCCSESPEFAVAVPAAVALAHTRWTERERPYGLTQVRFVFPLPE